MTEEQLRDAEKYACFFCAPRTAALVAEIRRLRGLLEEGAMVDLPGLTSYVDEVPLEEVGVGQYRFSLYTLRQSFSPRDSFVVGVFLNLADAMQAADIVTRPWGWAEDAWGQSPGFPDWWGRQSLRKADRSMMSIEETVLEVGYRGMEITNPRPADDDEES